MSALGHLRAIVSALLFVGVLVVGVALRAGDSGDRVSVINRRFVSVILPRVSFRDADLVGALEYLKRKAEEESNGALKMPFVLELPPYFRPRYELTLDVHSVPYAEALRYLAELSGVRFSQENGAVFVRPDTVDPAPPTSTPAKKWPVATPSPSKEQILTGTLGKPAEAVRGGGNVYRSIAGAVQPDKSGFIPRRGLNGFSEGKEGLDLNCPHLGKCPSGTCGCSICACATR
jgi:hypothetical protein